MKKFLILGIISILVISVPASADSKENVKKLYEKYSNRNYEAVTNEEALEILKSATGIDSSITGASGSESLQYYSYRKIRESEDLMIRLFNEAETNEGKVYALMGLTYLNREIYEKYYKLIDLDAYITRFSGCQGETLKIGDHLKKPSDLAQENNGPMKMGIIMNWY